MPIVGTVLVGNVGTVSRGIELRVCNGLFRKYSHEDKTGEKRFTPNEGGAVSRCRYTYKQPEVVSRDLGRAARLTSYLTPSQTYQP